MSSQPLAGPQGVEWVVFKCFPVRDEHGRWKPLGDDPPEHQIRRIGTVRAPDREAALTAAHQLFRGRLTVRSQVSLALDREYQTAIARHRRPIPLERLMRKPRRLPPAARRLP